MGISRNSIFHTFVPHQVQFAKATFFKDAKAALEIQDQILQKAEINKSDEQWLKEVVTGLAASTKDFQAMVTKTHQFSALLSECFTIWVDL